MSTPVRRTIFDEVFEAKTEHESDDTHCSSEPTHVEVDATSPRTRTTAPRTLPNTSGRTLAVSNDDALFSPESTGVDATIDGRSTR